VGPGHGMRRPGSNGGGTGGPGWRFGRKRKSRRGGRRGPNDRWMAPGGSTMDGPFPTLHRGLSGVQLAPNVTLFTGTSCRGTTVERPWGGREESGRKTFHLGWNWHRFVGSRESEVNDHGGPRGCRIIGADRGGRAFGPHLVGGQTVALGGGRTPNWSRGDHGFVGTSFNWRHGTRRGTEWKKLVQKGRKAPPGLAGPRVGGIPGWQRTNRRPPFGW